MNSGSQSSSERHWDDDVASLLADLSEVQQETLDHLAEKRNLLARGDLDGLTQQQVREAALIDRLESFQQRRQQLLAQAADVGLPCQSLHHLSSALEPAQRERMSPALVKASSQAQLLRHHSLTNWVLAQRHLIHVSYLIEILATGGKPRPTYGKGPTASESGALVDRAA